MVRALLVLVVLLVAVAVAEGRESCSGAAAGPCPSYDVDGDGIRNEPPYPPGPDNCVDVKNADQRDVDGDGAGDACDGDDDADGVADDADNCPFVANAGQADSDGAGRGDACPAEDTDADGAYDDVDNCPGRSNPDQADFDQDRRGDPCDGDDDTDGVPDYMDNCPQAENASQEDQDGDKIGRACDPDEIAPPTEPSPTPTAGPGTEAGTEADRTAPVLTVTAARTWTAGDLRGSAPLSVRCSEACGVTARLTLRGRLIADGVATLGGAGRTYVFFRARRGSIPRVARLRPRGRAGLTVRAVDEAGNRRTAKRRVWLRR